MRSFNSLILIFFLFSGHAYSQDLNKRWDNWYFFSRTGLRINGCGAIPLTDGNCTEAAGSSTISDPQGNLLFYSNGKTIWNKQHQPMPNGVMSGFWPEGEWHYQGPVLAPMPENDSLYYMFFLNRTWDNFPNSFVKEFHYNIININADSGRGDVIVKEQKLYTDPTEGVAAVMHANNRDYWIVSHKSNSDSFVVHKLSSSGLDPTPQYFKVGPLIPAGWRPGQNIIRFSPDRTKLVISRRVIKADPANYEMDGGFDLYHFNATTGEIKDPVVIRDGFISLHSPVWDRYFSTGAEFSPNSKKLYISTWDHLFQFDVSSYDSAAINNTRYLISSSDIYSYGLGNLQLASNGIIYMAKYYSNEYLAAVQYPDGAGAACDFSMDAVHFPGMAFPGNWSHFLGYGLNNSIHPYLRNQAYDSTSLQSLQTCLQDSAQVTIYSLMADSVFWNFGDPSSGISNTSRLLSPKHLYTLPGNYLITCIIYSSCSIDTVRKYIDISSPAPDLGPDAAICEGEKLVLRQHIAGAAYLWNSGSTADSLVIDAGGTYWLEVTKGECRVRDTILVTVKPVPLVNLQNDTTICEGKNLAIDLTMPSVQSYLWSDNNMSAIRTLNQAGLYWAELTGTNGCVKRDTLFLSVKPPVIFTLGPDTSLCENQQLAFHFTYAGASYLWSDGSTTGNQTITSSGIYGLTISKEGCDALDEIQVEFKPLPAVSLGDDKFLCRGTPLQLLVEAQIDSLRWQNGITVNPFIVTQPGIYTVQVFKAGCSSKDTITISEITRPVFSLGRDTAICLQQGLRLDPRISPAQYLWQDGSSNSSLFVNKEGTYRVEISNECGTSSDAIVISKGICRVILPYAFTPNNDGLNDLFRIINPGWIRSCRLTVYNRYGEKVFETTNPAIGWDGTVKGTIPDTGNFAWTLQYDDLAGKKESLKGSVLLIR